MYDFYIKTKEASEHSFYPNPFPIDVVSSGQKKTKSITKSSIKTLILYY